MASIIVDLSDDIKKLQSLKSEIQQVKKELGTINVKVDLDIKRDMEARLKSLTDQYDTLVQKVAQAEARIAESAARINKSAKTIINAQEQMAKSATGQGGTNTQGASGTSTEANRAETASVEAQAKAYDELADEIDAVMGTRSQNIRRMLEEQNAIRLINAEIKNLSKYQGENSTLSASQQRRLEQLNASLLQHKAALSELRQSLNNSFKLDNAAATSMNALSQSLGRMRMAYRELTEEERNSPFGKELLASIQQADAKIKSLDATIGNHQRNVGNYASGWNGLGMSIQQIGRELPSLAMGWNTFFLAISNNLPILADEIKRAKNEYNELKKAGQQATPVWKQVASSLLSWQTALTVGITLLTMYGKDIVEWAKNALVGESAAEKLKNQLLELNEIEKDAHATQIRTRAELDNVISSIKNFNGTREQEKQKIDELNSKYGSIFGSYNNLAQWYDILISKGDDYINSLFAQAKAQSYIQKAIEADQKIRDIKANGIEEYRPLWGRGGRIYQFFGGGNTNLGSDPAKLAYDEALKQAEEERDDFLENAEQLQKEYLQGIKKAGIFDYRDLFDTDKDGAVNSLKSYLDELSKLQEDYEDRQIDLMKDGTEKQLAEINLRYDRELEAVKKLRANLEKAQGGKLTTEQTSTFDAAVAGIETGRKMETRNVWKEQIRQQEQAWNEYLQKYGTYQQKRKAIIEKYNQEINEAQTAGDAAIKTEEQKAALEQLDEQYGKSTRAMADLFEDASQKSVSSIQKIIDKYELLVNYLSRTKQGDGTVVTPDELQAAGFTDRDIEKIEKGEISIKDLTDALKGLKEELKEKSPWQSFVSDMQKGIDKLKSTEGDTQKIGGGIMDIGNAVTSFAPVLGEFAGNIASIFGAEDTNITEIANAIGGLGQTAAGVGQIMSGDIFGGIMSAVGGISSIVSAFSQIHDKKNEKRIQQLQDQIDVLTSSYDKLGRAVEDAYSKDASNLIEQQNEMLEQQKVLIEQQIREEKDKKKTDDDRIKEWEQQLEEINQVIEENKGAAVDAIFGEDLQSAIDNFASAYADAWANGEDKAESAKETVKKMMQQMVTESIKAAIQSSGAMEEIRKKLEQFYADGVLTGWEQDYIYNMAEELQKEIDKQFGWTDSLMGGDSANEQQSASSKGFETMTQDQASELSGRFTALNESLLRQETIQQGISNIAEETRSIIAQSYLELQQISENTGEIIKPIKQMQLDMAEVKKNTSRL